MKNTILKSLALLALPVAAFAQTATVSTTEVTTAGVNFTTTAQAASATNYFKNDGGTVAVIQNHQSAPITATVVTQATTMRSDGYGSVALTDQVVSIPSGTTMLVGPFPLTRWTASGLTRINLTSSTNVSISTVKVSR